MKIEINKIYKARFSNALTSKGELVYIEKIVPGLTGIEVKLKGFNKPIIACAFVNIFERI